MSFFDELKRRNVFRVGIAYGVASWVLLQIVDLVLDNVEAPDWVMDVFMMVVVLGFVVALVISWAYEMTPEGIKKESDIERDDSVTHHTAKKLDVITLGAIGVLILFMVVDRFVLQHPAVPKMGPDTISPASSVQSDSSETEKLYPAPIKESVIEEKSIAVLPLANRSVNPEDAFFAEGMHDEILTRLSKIASLKVISRTSVMGYANTTKKMAEIGRELGVATLLEGGVQRAGNRVRINVQLIEAATDKHLWAEIFDRELTADNLFDIQSEITLSISNALQAVLTGDEQLSLSEKPTDNIEAYAHFLRGKASSLGYGREDEQIDIAISAYQAALELDPNFAEAWAALAIDWLEKHWGSIDRSDELENARLALEKAQQLAPNSTDTYTAEGYYHYWGFRDYDPAIVAFDKSLSIQPGNQLALRGKAYVSRRNGQLDEAIVLLDRVMRLDPLNAQVPADLGYSQLHTGQFREAKRMFQHAVAQSPENQWNLSSFSEYYLMIDDLESAITIIGDADQYSATNILDDHSLYARYANDAEAFERAINLIQRSTTRLELVELQKFLWEFQQGVTLDATALARLEQQLTLSAASDTDSIFELSSLLLVKAMQGDQAGLESAMERYRTELKPDTMRLVEDRTPILAYAMIGDAEGVFDIAEQMVEEFGPWELYQLVGDPLFDKLRGDPRFKMLALQYDRWLETVQ